MSFLHRVRLAAYSAIVAACLGVLAVSMNRSEPGIANLPLISDDEDLSRQAQEKCEHEEQRIAAALLSGRLNLLDAAAQIGALDWPLSFWTCLSIRHPARTAEESLCKHVIEAAVTQISDPTEAEEVRHQLLAKLEESADRHGRIALLWHLPGLRPTPAEAHVD